MPDLVGDDAVQMKANRLPNLQELTIELIPSYEAPKAETISRMRQQCEDVGVMLSVTIKSPLRSSLGPMSGGW